MPRKTHVKYQKVSGEFVKVPKRPKRALSAYNIFVKDHIKQFASLPSHQRMSEVAKLWRAKH